MSFFGKMFTWWNGATFGTALFTSLKGTEVGRDDAGNVYYTSGGEAGRRWVIYNGSNDGSRVPPGWQLWLKGTISDIPANVLPPRRNFELPAEQNLTGTMAAFRPDGALGSGKIRPASTGDYQPWIPE